MDKAVESILKWLQTRYKQKNRIGELVNFGISKHVVNHEQAKTPSFFFSSGGSPG